MIHIVSTRFTNKTLYENRLYRDKHGSSFCIYGSPQEFSPKILHDAVVFVVEMNNEKNQIEGIGLIRNHSYTDKYYKIHNDANYNRYVYKSNYFIERDTLIRHRFNIVRALDYILFKEKTHLKRGSGFTTIPEKLLKHSICIDIDMKKEIKSLFVELFTNNIDSQNEEKI